MSFREKLLNVMDQKNHWGWKFLSGPGLSKSQLLIHFQQEYEVYVRDFPILLARILGRMGTGDENLKRELAENIFEEQTGDLSKKISQGNSHPKLFLKMMVGLGFSEKKFKDIELLPTSLAYRCFLDQMTLNEDWRIGAGILMLFVEGSLHDRSKLKSNYREKISLAQKLRDHALIKYYKLDPKYADLVRVHYAVEGGHRKSAWQTLLKLIPNELEDQFVLRMEQALELWLLFRDGVCVEMGLENEEFRNILVGN